MSTALPVPGTASSDDLGPETVLASWLLTALAALFLTARIGAKLWTRRGLWVDDYVLIMAWVCASSGASSLTLGKFFADELLLDNPPRAGHNINVRCFQRPWKACLQHYLEPSISGTFAERDRDYPHHRSCAEQDLLCHYRFKDCKRLDERDYLGDTRLNQYLPWDQRCHSLGEFQSCTVCVCPQSQPFENPHPEANASAFLSAPPSPSMISLQHALQTYGLFATGETFPQPRPGTRILEVPSTDSPAVYQSTRQRWTLPSSPWPGLSYPASKCDRHVRSSAWVSL